MIQLMIQEQKKVQDEKRANLEQLNRAAQKGQILFTGSSLMEQFPINELCMSWGIDRVIYNRGIGGTTTEDFLAHINTVLLDLEPAKVFINIGTNDIRKWEDGRDWMQSLLSNYGGILTICREKLPETKVFVMAYYPVNSHAAAAQSLMMQETLSVRTNKALNQVNEELAKLSEQYGYTYIDVNDGLKDGNGRLKEELTVDGMHMYPDAYRRILQNLLRYL